MSEKLEPCPFCGKMDTVGVFARRQIEELDDWDDADCFAVCCDATTGGCGAVGGYTSIKGAAIKRWNRRAPLYPPVKPEDVTPGHYWLVTPDGEKTMEQIWDGYGNCGLCIQDPIDGWITVEEIYKWGGMLYSIPPLEVAE